MVGSDLWNLTNNKFKLILCHLRILFCTYYLLLFTYNPHICVDICEPHIYNHAFDITIKQTQNSWFWWSVTSCCSVCFVLFYVLVFYGLFCNVMVPLNLTCLHCLQHFFFEHLVKLYYTVRTALYIYIDFTYQNSFLRDNN